jgi:type IV pilus assembly protein PilO
VAIEEKLHAMSLPQAVIAGGVFAAVYYFLLFNDGSRIEARIQQAQTQLDAERKELSNLEQQIEDARRMQAMADKMGEEIKQVGDYLPEKFSSVDLMRIVNEEIKAVGVNLENLTSGNSAGMGNQNEGSSFYEKVSVDVSLEGEFNQLLVFLSNLTRVKKILILKKFTLRSEMGASGDARDLKFQATIEGYRFIDEATQQGGAPQ